jgi:hydrogenase nickel incorporation protein HypB
MNPQVTIIPVSAKTGQGLEQWFGWIKAQRKVPQALIG